MERITFSASSINFESGGFSHPPIICFFRDVASNAIAIVTMNHNHTSNDVFSDNHRLKKTSIPAEFVGFKQQNEKPQTKGECVCGCGCIKTKIERWQNATCQPSLSLFWEMRNAVRLHLLRWRGQSDFNLPSISFIYVYKHFCVYTCFFLWIFPSDKQLY